MCHFLASYFLMHNFVPLCLFKGQSRRHLLSEQSHASAVHDARFSKSCLWVGVCSSPSRRRREHVLGSTTANTLRADAAQWETQYKHTKTNEIIRMDLFSIISTARRSGDDDSAIYVFGNLRRGMYKHSTNVYPLYYAMPLLTYPCFQTIFKL